MYRLAATFFSVWNLLGTKIGFLPNTTRNHLGGILIGSLIRGDLDLPFLFPALFLEACTGRRVHILPGYNVRYVTVVQKFIAT